MKTTFALLLLTSLALSALAQPAPNSPGAIPAPSAPPPLDANTRSNRLANIRELMRERLAATNAAATNPPAAAAPLAQTKSGASGPLVIPAPVITPAASNPAPRSATTTPAGPGAVPAAAPGGAPGAVAPGARAAVAQAPLALEDVATNIFNFPAVDLNTFLNDFYAPMLGRTILRASTLPAATITLRTMTPLTRKESIQAFDTVLSMNGITTIPTGEKFVKVVQTPQALQEAASFNRLDATNLPDAAQFVTQIVQLKYVKPSEVLPILTPFGKIPNSILPVEGSQMLVIRDFAENVKRMLELIADIDVAIPAEYTSEVIPIKYALASEISSALSSLSSGGGVTSVGSSGTGRTGMGATGGASRFGRAGGAGGFGTTPGMPGQPGASPFGSTTPGGMPGAQPTFSDRLRSIIQKASTPGSGEFQILGQTKIIADDRTNSLLIFAGREDMKMIKDIISKLDVVLPQVLIEALIIEVSLNNSEDFGLSYAQTAQSKGKLTSAWSQITKPFPADPPTSIGSFGTNLTGGFNWFGKIKDDFYVSLAAAASDGRISVLSRPRIQTSNAKQASLFVGESRPYPTSSYYGGGAYGGYSQIQQLPIGISLDVLPLINQDGLVVMDIQQKVESIGDEVAIQGVGNVPSTFSRSANASVSVRSGETIILGGFIKNNESLSKSGVPFLKDIPLLGNLFRSSSKTTGRQELLVLIRPTVLPNPQDAAIAATNEKAKMPLVQRAEVDLEYQNADRAKHESSSKTIKPRPADAKANNPAVWGPPPAN